MEIMFEVVLDKARRVAASNDDLLAALHQQMHQGGTTVGLQTVLHHPECAVPEDGVVLLQQIAEIDDALHANVKELGRVILRIHCTVRPDANSLFLRTLLTQIPVLL